MESQRVGLGILGYGTIAKEVVEYYGRDNNYAEVIAIARRDLSKDAPEYVKSILTDNAHEVIDNPKIDIVIELTGDDHAADYIMRAITAGKHVVTGHKAAVAENWTRLVQAARQHGVALGVEATVGGGVPIVRVMQRHASNDEVQSFFGILNGTCNFVISEMKPLAAQQLSRSLEDTVKLAQELGYADPDPSTDLNGLDTKYKVAILTNLAFETSINPAGIFCEGISDPKQRILPCDFYFLENRSYLNGRYELKLLGIAERYGSELTLRVHPALIERDGPYSYLAEVQQNFNGILLGGVRLGRQYFYGLGAGKEPTAISVVSDIREIAESILRARTEKRTRSAGAETIGPLLPKIERFLTVRNFDSVPTRGYIRSLSPDKKGLYAKKLAVLAEYVNVQTVFNVREFDYDGLMADYIEIDNIEDGTVRKGLDAIRQLEDVQDPMYFRILES